MLTNGIRQLVVLMIIAVIPALCLARWQAVKMENNSLGSGEIAPADARRFPADTVQFVDARSLDDYARGHRPGAVLLNAAGWGALIAGFYDAWEPGKKVIVYGRARSDEAATVAHRLRTESGLDQVFVLKGIWEECP
jgi:rhodanese-related sulfurtransferase